VRKKWYVNFCRYSFAVKSTAEPNCLFPCISPQLTNALQRKLDEVRREKLLLENQIESEKKSHQMLESELDELRQNSSRSEAQPPQKTIAKAEALEEEEMEEED
jgi:uncharacterized protein YlxW (UPF0749 family)